MTLFILIVVILSALRAFRLFVAWVALIAGLHFGWDFVDEYYTEKLAAKRIFTLPVHCLISSGIAIWGFILLIT
jgi:hypothetical protein